MAFQENELHKIILRLEALEAGELHENLKPDPLVAQLSTVVLPVKPEVQGSGTERYNDHWDTGFAGLGDPYGIHTEYVAQSASPNAVPTQFEHNPNVVPTQAEADAAARGE